MTRTHRTSEMPPPILALRGISIEPSGRRPASSGGRPGIDQAQDYEQQLEREIGMAADVQRIVEEERRAGHEKRRRRVR